MKFRDLKNKKIHIVGLSGTEGSSLALFFINKGVKKLSGHDFSSPSDFNDNYYSYHKFQSKRTSDQQIKKIKSALKISYKNLYLSNIKEADLIFTPSSWFRYQENKKLKGLKIYNWYNLLLEIYNGKIIGVTGTAGKGTTTHLIYSILKKAKKKVYLAGDAWQMIEIEKIKKMGKNSYLILELSNRTLTFAKQTKKSPHIAVLTNISKHHLDDHQNSFIKYVAVKKEIANYQTKLDYFIFNQDDAQSKKMKSFGRAKKIPYSYNNGERKLITNNKIIGKHLITDAIAAIKIAKILKINKNAIKLGLKNFKSRSGRMQFIAKKNNITFINDGASTRPKATIEAIKSFPKGRVNLILEGSRPKAKQDVYFQLMKVIKSQKVKNITVSGSISGLLYPMISKINKSALKTHNLQESVSKLFQLSDSDDIILLSPANESFGEFKDYRERIEKFNLLVDALK